MGLTAPTVGYWRQLVHSTVILGEASFLISARDFREKEWRAAWRQILLLQIRAFSKRGACPTFVLSGINGFGFGGHGCYENSAFLLRL